MADNTKQNMASVQHVFVIGSKSIGQYGGYETFVDKLTEQHQNDPTIKYHIACKANGDGFTSLSLPFMATAVDISLRHIIRRTWRSRGSISPLFSTIRA